MHELSEYNACACCTRRLVGIGGAHLGRERGDGGRAAHHRARHVHDAERAHGGQQGRRQLRRLRLRRAQEERHLGVRAPQGYSTAHSIFYRSLHMYGT